MNPLILVTFLALGATANSYGSSNSYGGSSSYGSSSSSNSYGGGYGKSGEGNAAITSFNRQIQGSNSDTTSFTTSNGISQSHNVRVVKGNAYRDTYGNTYGGGDTIAMNGHSYHTSPEGMHISLTWNADQNGFSATGDHLPKSVALPAEHAEAYRQALAASSGYGSGGYSGNDGYNSNSGYNNNAGYSNSYVAPQVTTISFQGAPQQSYGSNSYGSGGYQQSSNSYAAPATSYSAPQQQSYQSSSYSAPQVQSYQPATQSYAQSSDNYSQAPARTVAYQPSGYSSSSSYGSSDNSYNSAPARTIAYQPSGHSYGPKASDSYSAPQQPAKTMSYQPSSSSGGY